MGRPHGARRAIGPLRPCRPDVPGRSQVTLAKVGPDGAGTLIGLDGPTVLDGVTYVDLGTLATGRFVGVVDGYELQAAASSGQISATTIGWAVGLVVWSWLEGAIMASHPKDQNHDDQMAWVPIVPLAVALVAGASTSLWLVVRDRGLDSADACRIVC